MHASSHRCMKLLEMGPCSRSGMHSALCCVCVCSSRFARAKIRWEVSSLAHFPSLLVIGALRSILLVRLLLPSQHDIEAVHHMQMVVPPRRRTQLLQLLTCWLAASSSTQNLRLRCLGCPLAKISYTGGRWPKQSRPTPAMSRSRKSLVLPQPELCEQICMQGLWLLPGRCVHTPSWSMAPFWGASPGPCFVRAAPRCSSACPRDFCSTSYCPGPRCPMDRSPTTEQLLVVSLTTLTASQIKAGTTL